MFKMISFAKQYWKTMVLILILLFVQAACELSLPQYTSDIVDNGIQAAGIDSCVPDVLRQETAGQLMLLLEEDEKEAFQNAYTEIRKENLSQEDYASYLKNIRLWQTVLSGC